MIYPEKCRKFVEQVNLVYGISLNHLLTEDAIVFGGIIRDFVVDEDISKSKDIDIIVSKYSLPLMDEYLNNKGYKYENELTEQESFDHYQDNSFEVMIYKKGDKRIDLIIPKITYNKKLYISDLIVNLNHLITVDLTSSLIGYNIHIGLLYQDEDAMNLISRKIFSFRPDSPRFKLEKAEERAIKLKQKGWILIDGKNI